MDFRELVENQATDPNNPVIEGTPNPKRVIGRVKRIATS